MSREGKYFNLELSEEIEMLWNERLQKQSSTLAEEHTFGCSDQCKVEIEPVLQMVLSEDDKKMVEEDEIKHGHGFITQQATSELKPALTTFYQEEKTVTHENGNSGSAEEDKRRTTEIYSNGTGEPDKDVPKCKNTTPPPSNCSNADPGEDQFTDDDLLYTAAATIRKSDKPAQETFLVDKEVTPILPDININNVVQEIREPGNVAFLQGTTEEKNQGNEHSTVHVKPDDHAEESGFLSRIFQYLSECITQCGDCCF